MATAAFLKQAVPLLKKAKRLVLQVQKDIKTHSFDQSEYRRMCNLRHP